MGVLSRSPRDELRREQRLRFAQRANLEEIPREALTPWRYGFVDPDGTKYRVNHGEVGEAQYATPVTAFFTAADGTIVFLEPMR